MQLWFELKEDNPNWGDAVITKTTLSVMLGRHAKCKDTYVLMDRKVIGPSELIWLRDHWPFDGRKPLEAALATALDITLNGSEQ